MQRFEQRLMPAGRMKTQVLACVWALSGCAAITVPGQVVDNAVPIHRAGEACGGMVLGIMIGDTSVGMAMMNGRLAAVSRIDYELYGVPVLLAKYCTIVHGAYR